MIELRFYVPLDRHKIAHFGDATTPVATPCGLIMVARSSNSDSIHVSAIRNGPHDALRHGHGVVSKDRRSVCDRLGTVDVPWRKQKKKSTSSEFGSTFQREVLLFLEIPYSL